MFVLGENCPPRSQKLLMPEIYTALHFVKCSIYTPTMEERREVCQDQHCLSHGPLSCPKLLKNTALHIVKCCWRLQIRKLLAPPSCSSAVFVNFASIKRDMTHHCEHWGCINSRMWRKQKEACVSCCGCIGLCKGTLAWIWRSQDQKL